MNSNSLIFSFLFFLAPMALSVSSPRESIRKLDANSCALSGSWVKINELSEFWQPKFMNEMQSGNTLTYFAMLKDLDTLTESEWEVLKTVAPLTSFNNQKLENNVEV